LASIRPDSKAMWLPTAVYERVPQFWLLMGLFFVLGGLYLGPDHPVAFMYIVIGVLSTALGIAVALHRAKYRQKRPAENSSETGSDAN